MPKIPEKNFFRPKESAQILTVSVDTIYRWIKDGTLAAGKIKGRLKISRDEVVRLYEKSMSKAAMST